MYVVYKNTSTKGRAKKTSLSLAVFENSAHSCLRRSNQRTRARPSPQGPWVCWLSSWRRAHRSLTPLPEVTHALCLFSVQGPDARGRVRRHQGSAEEDQGGLLLNKSWRVAGEEKGSGKEIMCQCIIADMGNYQPFIQTAVGLNLLTFLLFRVSALNCFWVLGDPK